ELRNIVEYAVNLCQGEEVQVEDLPAYLSAPAEPLPPPAADRLREGTAGPSGVGAAAGDTADAGTWAAVERRLITEALIKTGGRRSQAAQALGWGRTTLWRKMRYHGLD
ncbi:MAG: helix-turn-helix domain-containing protein, partial [Thermodesulfobacteriota bacterium]